jgi:hypothetical protein
MGWGKVMGGSAEDFKVLMGIFVEEDVSSQ